MAEEEGKKEEKFEFTPEGETLGYISLDQARVLAMRTARESPGDYGRRFRTVPMAFEVVQDEETEDHYVVTLSLRPQGRFTGTPGQEQFFIEKEGAVAHRQVLGLPTSGGMRRFIRNPVSVMAVAVAVVAAAVVIGVVLATGGRGAADTPPAGSPPTSTLAPASSQAQAEAPPTATALPLVAVNPTATPTLEPGPSGLGTGGVVTVQYLGHLHVRASHSGGSWEPGETSYTPFWSFDASSPVRYSVTTAKPRRARGGESPFSSAIGPSGSYTYVWSADRNLRLELEEGLMVDSGLRLQREVIPSTLQPGENRVSIRVVAEVLRPPAVNGRPVRPTGGRLRTKIGDEGSGFSLGDETLAVAGGSPIKIVSLRGSPEIDLAPPVEVGRVYTLEFEVGLLNPNPFPVAYVPILDLTMEIDTLPLGLETPVGTYTDVAAVAFDVRGAAGELFQFGIENPSGEKIEWQVDSRFRPIFQGLAHHWGGRLAPAN